MKSTKDGASNEHWITDLKNKIYMKQTNLRISVNHLLTHSDPSCWYSSMWACVKTSNPGHLVLTSHYIVDPYGFSSPNREFFCLGS